MSLNNLLQEIHKIYAASIKLLSHRQTICNDRKGMKANRVGLNSVLESGLSISTSCSKYCVAWTHESRKEILKPARHIVGQTSCRTVDDSMTSYHHY